jgi:type IV pilus assembly protein PilV
MCSIIDNDKGFTLIEVLIAMVVLTIGILAMMTMQTRAVTANHRASTMASASSVAAGQMERFQTIDYLDPTLTNGNHPAVPDPATNYPVSWTVTDNSPVNGTKRIAITVQVPNNGPTVTYEYIKNRAL